MSSKDAQLEDREEAGV